MRNDSDGAALPLGLDAAGECFEETGLHSPNPKRNTRFGYEVASSEEQILVSQLGEGFTVPGTVHAFARIGGAFPIESVD